MHVSVPRYPTLSWVAALAACLVVAVIWRGTGIRPQKIVFPQRDTKPVRPSDSTTFFADRNTVIIDVSRPMTVDELISRYRLEESRAEILMQVNTKDGRTLLPAGRRLTVTITPLLEPLLPRETR
jgi:hypothetical protein